MPLDDNYSYDVEINKVPIKSADKKQPIKSADKTTSNITLKQKEIIIQFAKENGKLKSADLLTLLNIGETRAKTLLREMAADGILVSEGGNRNRIYKLP